MKVTDWEDGTLDAEDVAYNTRFPISDDTLETFYQENVAIYWYGTYAAMIWYTLFFSYFRLGARYKNCLEGRAVRFPMTNWPIIKKYVPADVGCLDFLTWMSRFNE